MSSVSLLIRRTRRLRRTSRRRRCVVGAAPTGAVVVVVVMVMLLRLRLPERLAHIVRVLPIGVVLRLDVVDLVPEGGSVEVEGGAVGSADVEGDVLGAEDLVHGCLHYDMSLVASPSLRWERRTAREVMWPWQGSEGSSSILAST